VMIHNAWGFAMGNAADMRQLADLLDKIDGTLVEQYAARTKNDPARIREWMTAETWFTGKDAVENGFADRLAPLAGKQPTACLRPDQFRHAPAALLASARPGPSQRVQAAAMARRLALARAVARA
jgi:ATP-dependent Clp protease protease subunit